MIIYKITNTVNGKVYIGLTIQPLNRRWDGHTSHSRDKKPPMLISRAIARYGPDAFTVEQIATADTLEGLKALEIKLIAEHNSCKREYGYNLSIGGEGASGVKRSEESNSGLHRKSP